MSSPRTLARLLAGALALGLLAAFPALAAKDDLDLVSVATGGAVGDADSRQPSISGDGRHVAFVSDSDGLAPDDVDGVSNIFVRDVASGATTLVSRANGPLGAGADGDALWPSISGDGRYVAFQSTASNLTAGDANGVSDVFVRDMATGTTILVSQASNGAPGNASSTRPSISADGFQVAFLSDADTLVADANTLVANVMVRDLVTGTTSLASRATGPGGTGADAGSGAPAIAADGRRVAFASEASNLSDEDGDPARDVFVRDLRSSVTVLVSRASGAKGAAGGDDSDEPSISADGRRVAFASDADNLSTEDDKGVADIFVRDLPTATTVLASRATGDGTPADGGSEEPALSADGRFVAFQADADNLAADDDDRYDDIYLRDLNGATTMLVSRAAGLTGAAALGDSSSAAISADGRFVAFRSVADNLSAVDDDDVADVFRRDALGPIAPVVAPTAPRPIEVRCAGERATIVGTPRRDVIRGTAGPDVIHALAGDDVVRGLGGNDLVCLGAGDDRAVGGRGDDRLLGGLGRDRLDGGRGRDVLEGGAGRDILNGGPGRDRVNGGPGRDVGQGGAGRDVCRAERGAC